MAWRGKFRLEASEVYQGLAWWVAEVVDKHTAQVCEHTQPLIPHPSTRLLLTFSSDGAHYSRFTPLTTLLLHGTPIIHLFSLICALLCLSGQVQDPLPRVGEPLGRVGAAVAPPLGRGTQQVKPRPI